MALRQEGIEWLHKHYGSPVGPVHVSKYYDGDESWNKKPVWWFEFPESALDDTTFTRVHLVCQLIGEAEPFAHLCVPTDWLRERKQELHIRPGKGVSIYVSAEDDSLYREMRGTGQIEFSEFLSPSP